MRWTYAAVAMCLTLGCASGPTESALEPTAPESFVGSWRSVTPSLEFIRLSVASKASEMGVLAARLTLSGVAWEGAGRTDGDSLIANMTVGGVGAAGSVIVAHAPDARTLRVRMRPTTGAATELTFVRDN